MHSGLAALVDAVDAELAVANYLVRLDLLAMAMEVRNLLVGIHRREHVREFLDVAFMRELGIALSAGFQALGNGIYSTIVSICRQMLVLLPAAFLLSLSGEVNNVWWAFPIAEVVSLVVTMLLFVRIYRQKIKPMI